MVGAAAAALLLLSLGGAGLGLASTPSSGTIDGSKPVSWDFAAVAGAGLGGTPTPAVCAPGNCDRFILKIVLPAPDLQFYTHYKAQLSIHYTWTNSAPSGTDLDIFAFDPADDAAGPNGSPSAGPGSPDTQPTGDGYEDLIVNNPVSGPWSIRSAAGVAPTPTAAHAVAKLTFLPKPGQTVQAILPNDPKLTNYESPNGFEGRDVAQRPVAGEPSIGVNWKTGGVIYYESSQDALLKFDDTKYPATTTWTNVAPLKEQFANEDPIGFTDSVTGRAFSVGLLVACSNVDYSDDDGSNWSPSTGCAVPHSPDHESLGGGPPAKSAALQPTGYPHMVYYCSQNIDQTLGAFCAHSEDGGLIFDSPSTLVFGMGTPCGSIHGHIRVSPDGTVYIPQNACARKDGKQGEGMAVSADNGATYSYAVVPDSTHGNSDDPSVAAGAGNTVYYGYDNSDGYPMIAVSHDHGKTWAPSVNVGLPFGINNTEFPEVIAGDDDRAAFAFLGTTTPGATQADSFPGTWYMYVAYTFDGGNSWTTVNATPNDPVQRGCVWNGGGTHACRNMLDFNDITVDKMGRVLIAYTDGCTADCETNNKVDTSGCPVGGMGNSETAPIDSTPTCTYGRRMAMIRQSCGQGLFAAYDGQLPTGCYGVAAAQQPPAIVPAANMVPNTGRGPALPPGSLPAAGLLLILLATGAAVATVRARKV